MPILFNARAMLEYSLQVTEGRYDIQELLVVCRLFRLPMPATRIEAEPFPMPGAYPLSSENNMSGLAFPRATTSRVRRVLGTLFLQETKDFLRCPIDRLDDNILKHIFVLAYDNNLLLRGPLTLISVTKRWRTIVFTMPSLWGLLHIAAEDVLFHPFYSIIYHAFHAHDLHVWVNSPAVLASVTTLAAVIPPRIRSTSQVPQLRNLVLTGSGAIETMDAFPLRYPNLTHLGLMDLRRLFPINLLSNCPALETLSMECCVEVWNKRLDEEMLLYDNIPCTSLHIEWKSTWVPFDVYVYNLPIRLVKHLSFFLSNNRRFKTLPQALALISKNPNIESLVLRGVSLAYTNIEEIRPLIDLSLLSRLKLTDVDDATAFFRMCLQFPSAYFPRLVSLHLTNVRLNVDILMDYVRMKTGTIPVDVSPLQILCLEGIFLEESHLTDLELMRMLGQIEVKISL